MPTELGAWYGCPECGAEVLVAHAGAGTLTCCSRPMRSGRVARTTAVPVAGADEPSLVGKRYRCTSCGTALLYTRSGAAVAQCCDLQMSANEPQKLPAVGG